MLMFLDLVNIYFLLTLHYEPCDILFQSYDDIENEIIALDCIFSFKM